jgi:hypothetical protein
MPLRCCRQFTKHKIAPAPTIQDDIERLLAEHIRFYAIDLYKTIPYIITSDYIHVITERKAKFNELIRSAIDVYSESCVIIYQQRFNYIDTKINNTFYTLFKDSRIRFTKDAVKLPYVCNHILTHSNERASSIYA